MNRQRRARRIVVMGSLVCMAWSVPTLARQQPPAETARPPGSATAGQPMSPGQTAQHAQETSGQADSAFAKEAAQGGLAEVALGTLAAERAASDAVKQFGERMVSDHGKANEELKTLAQRKNMTLPSEPSAKQLATQKRLEKVKGEAFDRAYMQDMLTDHHHDIAAFEREASSGNDPEFKAWAAKTLPTLKAHLQLAQDAATKAGVKGGKNKT
jgi:putative membrane protein